MLTPVDLQQKKFSAGLGYAKSDVDEFYREVTLSYEQLYKLNVELKEEVETLNDSLQNYKSKEKTIDKNLMLAEKDAEDIRLNATKEADAIILKAKSQAKNIISDAENSLTKMQEDTAVLETQYAAYKSNFVTLLKRQLDFLKEEDFAGDAYIDDRALAILGGSIAPTDNIAQKFKNNPKLAAKFGQFTGDPQMRDESTLGGMQGSDRYASGGPSSFEQDAKTSTSAVYTSSLASGEDFVDPFNPGSNGRFNPFSDNDQELEAKRKQPGASNSSFTVKDGKKDPRRATPKKPMPDSKVKEEPKATPKPTPKAEPKPAPKAEPKPEPKKETKIDPIPEVKTESKPEPKVEPVKESESSTDNKINAIKEAAAKEAAERLEAKRKAEEERKAAEEAKKNAEEAAAKAAEEESLVGDVEGVNDTALIGDGSDDEDDGFEFI